jgi:hypothetical protein
MHCVRFVWVVIVLATIGCNGGSGSSSKISHDDYGTLRTASSMFSSYIGENGGKTPPDEQAFRTYLESKQDKLAELGKTVDELLTSPRNGEPIVFVYGKKPVPGPAGMTYFGYEKTPVDGKRLVLAGRGMYEEMDEAQFRKFFPDAQ